MFSIREGRQDKNRFELSARLSLRI